MLENLVQAAGENIWYIVLTILILAFLAFLIGVIIIIRKRKNPNVSGSGDVTAVPWAPALSDKKTPWRSQQIKKSRTGIPGRTAAGTITGHAGRTSVRAQRSWK